MRTTVLPPFLLLILLGALPVRADDKKPDDKKPAPKLPLGRDTTYITGPLDKHGYLDYETALNAELGRGITRESNAFALLLGVFGPRPEGSEMPPGFYKWLDTPPPGGGDYLVGMHTLFREQLGLTDAQLEAVYEEMSRATNRPWVPKDCPPLAEWLKVNEKPLALAAKAVERPHYFHPLVSRRTDDSPGSLIGSLLPGVQKCRELASAFSTRATLRIGEGKFDDAWADILACHRLGRLVSGGGTLIEGLVGVAIGQIAHNATLAYIDRAKLTSKQAAARLKEVRDLPPLAPLAGKIELMERYTGLETLQNLRRGGPGGFGFLVNEVFDEANKPSAEDLKALDRIDWTPTMKSMNKWYDRMAAAMRLKDRAAREKEFDAIEKDLLALKKDLTPEKLTKLIADKNGPGEVVGKAIGDALMTLLMPAVRKVNTAHDRAAQTERNLQVAFALAAHRADHGRYPEKLDDLAPKYLAAVPGDLFSGKPLVYKPSEKGYLFYSVGANGKDEGGRWYDDDPPGDDPRVRMPLPELKKK